LAVTTDLPALNAARTTSRANVVPPMNRQSNGWKDQRRRCANSVVSRAGGTLTGRSLFGSCHRDLDDAKLHAQARGHQGPVAMNGLKDTRRQRSPPIKPRFTCCISKAGRMREMRSGTTTEFSALLRTGFVMNEPALFQCDQAPPISPRATGGRRGFFLAVHNFNHERRSIESRGLAVAVGWIFRNPSARARPSRRPGAFPRLEHDAS